MCYTRSKEWSREEEARRLRAQERTPQDPARREADIYSERHEYEAEKKPLTEKVEEVVGVR